MLRNYFLISWRNLTRNKLFSLINVFGLGLSMSVGVLVLIRISDAFDYDSFHPQKENIYRIVSNVTNAKGDHWTLASSPLPLADALRVDDENAISVTKIYPGLHSIIKDASREFDFNGTFIEPGFFDIFGFQLRSGNASSLRKANTLLLSESFSNKFFGDKDPVGMLVTVGDLGEFEIAGVLKTPPTKSHIQYDVFVSSSSIPLLERSGKLSSKLNDWDSFELAYTYVKVKDHRSLDPLSNTLARLQDQISSEVKQSTETASKGWKFEFELQPLTSISPSPADIYNDIGRSPSLGSLIAEISIVLVILVAACFNYTNLSIARALTRGKEVGVRKLSGATRLQIVSQYVMEAMLISSLAVVVSIVILIPILEYKPFNDGYEMIPELHMSWRLVGLVAAFTLLTALMAGVLPAWLLSSFKPVQVLRGVASQRLMGQMSLRKSLLVFQFSLSLVVLVFLSTFYRQFNFLATADPGFKRENIVLVPQGSHGQVSATAFSRIHGVTNVGFASARFGRGGSVPVSREANSAGPVSANYYSCDRAWIDIMDLKTVSGTTDLQHPADVVLNEKASGALGFKLPDEAVGSMIYLRDSLKVNVIGVVKDFYSSGYGNAIQPLVLQADASAFRTISVESDQSNLNLVDDLKKEWSKNNPGHSFEYTWLDEKMREEGDQTATVSLLGFLGFITLTIGSLGLLGLVVYSVEVKRKEISIRKIIGSSVNQLILLLSKGFLALLMLAGAIALPVGYLLSSVFLTNFVNRVAINWIQVLSCFGLLMAIGLVTILSQTFRAANENPVKNLRME